MVKNLKITFTHYRIAKLEWNAVLKRFSSSLRSILCHSNSTDKQSLKI